MRAPRRGSGRRSSTPTSIRIGPQLALLLLLVVAGVAATIVFDGGGASSKRETNDVTRWAPPGSKPLSDKRAAALVTPDPENVPENATANRRVPTKAEVARFRSARNNNGETNVQFNPLTRYVTGRPGLNNPSTDQLIQWASHKWGIPTDWMRAQLVLESHWHQSQLGDVERVPAKWYEQYPLMARIPGGHRVNESLGIAQQKWIPDGSVGAGTEPLRWQSTAFNLDVYAATIRYYYDGKCGWCSRGYRAGQAWKSIGAWYSPNPWWNQGARDYVKHVKQILAERTWTQPGF